MLSKNKFVLGCQIKARSEFFSFSIKELTEPLCVVASGTLQTKASHLHGDDFQGAQGSITRIQIRVIHQLQVGMIAFVSGDSLVIVDEITTAEKYELVPVNLDCPYVMGRMSMDHVDLDFVD